MVWKTLLLWLCDAERLLAATTASQLLQVFNDFNCKIVKIATTLF